MPGGAIAVAVLLLLLTRAKSATLEHPGVRYLTLAVVALMPWLHVRFLLPAVILTGAIIWVRRRWSWRSALLEVSPAFLSAMALAGYNLYAWGRLSGTDRSGGQELAPGWQAFLRFLALNVDRFQGMFVQQPLLLLAIPGVVLLFRRTRDIAVVTIGLYLAFLVPNALHPNWFGGASFTGRFGLAAAIVLLAPAAVAMAALARRFAVLTSALAGVAICLNIWLYSRIWGGSLPLMSQPAGEPRSAYPSWLPFLGRSLPALNRVRWGASFGPNYVVPVAFVTLALGCILVLSTKRRLGTALIVLSVAAFVVPAASATPSASQDAAYLRTGRTGRATAGSFAAVPLRDKSGLLAEGPAFDMTDQADWNVSMQYSSPASHAVVVGTVALWTRHVRWCVVRLRGTTGQQTSIDISWTRRARPGSLRIPIMFTARAPLQLGHAAISRGKGPKDAEKCRTQRRA